MDLNHARLPIPPRGLRFSLFAAAAIAESQHYIEHAIGGQCLVGLNWRFLMQGRGSQGSDYMYLQQAVRKLNLRSQKMLRRRWRLADLMTGVAMIKVLVAIRPED